MATGAATDSPRGVWRTVPRNHAGLLSYAYICISWWRHQMETFSALLVICSGTSPVTGEFPTQRSVPLNLLFSLICACINGWENNRKAGDLRRHRTHLDVIVMFYLILVVYSVSICCVSPSNLCIQWLCTALFARIYCRIPAFQLVFSSLKRIQMNIILFCLVCCLTIVVMSWIVNASWKLCCEILRHFYMLCFVLKSMYILTLYIFSLHVFYWRILAYG